MRIPHSNPRHRALFNVAPNFTIPASRNLAPHTFFPTLSRSACQIKVSYKPGCFRPWFEPATASEPNVAAASPPHPAPLAALAPYRAAAAAAAAAATAEAEAAAAEAEAAAAAEAAEAAAMRSGGGKPWKARARGAAAAGTTKASAAGGATRAMATVLPPLPPAGAAP